MSNIDTQIKKLLLKKKQIDYLSYVADLIKNDKKCVDFKDVQEELVSKIEPFLLQLMESIEKDTVLQNNTIASPDNTFSAEETRVLKLVASKALNKPPAQAAALSEPRMPKAPVKEASAGDKMNFAMANRHLGNKRVQVINDKNVQLFGTVVGLDAPHVIVKTDTGPTIEVPLEKVVLA